MKLSSFLVAALAFAMPFGANSIVIRHDVSDEDYRATIADFPPLATLYRIGAHGTLIHPQWVVTAAHAIFCMEPGVKIQLGEQSAEVAAVYSHADYQLNKSNDIALLKLRQPVLSVEPAVIYRENDEKGKQLWFIGAGGTGNGKEGQQLSYKENKGQLRKAQNTVRKTSKTDIFFTFDQGDKALPLEGVSGNGDSGGPAYKKIADVFYLLGVSSRTDSWFKQVGEYGVNEVYSRISYHADWLDAVMSGNTAFIDQRTTQNRFPQPGMGDLEQVCQKILLP